MTTCNDLSDASVLYSVTSVRLMIHPQPYHRHLLLTHGSPFMFLDKCSSDLLHTQHLIALGHRQFTRRV